MILTHDDIKTAGRAPTREEIECEKRQQMDSLKKIRELLRLGAEETEHVVSCQESRMLSWARGI